MSDSPRPRLGLSATTNSEELFSDPAVRGIPIKVSNVHGTDLEENMYTVSVGEHARRFTHEQMNDGEAGDWVIAVIAVIKELASNSTEKP